MDFPLFIASANPGKLKEIAELVELYFPKFFSEISGRAALNAIESEYTFIGNAQIKALALESEIAPLNFSRFAILSDDSGLCVDLLKGAPGVHSARYAGDHCDPEDHIQKLLSELKKVPESNVLENRKAHYSCALTLVVKVHQRRFLWNTEGQCHGLIAFSNSGTSGFGYDPIFYVPEFKKSFGEIPFEIKNQISHRQRAFQKLKEYTKDFLWPSKV